MVKFQKSIKIQVFLIALLTFLAYSNIFQNQFVIDDKTFIENWQEIRSLSNIPKFFEGIVPIGHEGVYRPVRSVLYAIYFQIFATNPFGYHLHSIIVHIIITVLIFFIIKRITRISMVAFVVGLLFGLHPIHTETITYIASSMDAVGILFFFASFYFFLKKKLFHSYLLAIFAFFTNETTLVLPILIVFYGFFIKDFKRKKIITIYAPFFLGGFVYFFIRFFILHLGSRGPYLANSIYLTILTMSKVFVKYILLILFPINQANNHTIWGGIEAFIYRGYNPDPIKAQTIFNPVILLSVTLISIIIFFAIKLRKKLPLITFGIGWFFISLFPVSEIIPQGSILGERFLYIPSFGFVLTLALLLEWIRKKLCISNIWVLTFYFLLFTFYFFGTYQRNKDWVDEISFWKHDIKVYPKTNSYAYFQLGNQYKLKGNYYLAVQNYEESFKINPYFAVAIASEGLAYESLKEENKSIEAYKKALQTDPLFWEGYYKLGNIYAQQGKLDLAKNEYSKLLQIYPDLPDLKVIIYNLEKKIEQKSE